MNLTEAKALGYQRGQEAVDTLKTVSRIDKETVGCRCPSKHMCDLCLSFAAHTKEESRRIKRKAEWFNILKALTNFRDPIRIQNVFEDGVFSGVKDGVRDRLKD